MPELTTVGLFALSALALVAVPGPNLVYIVTRSVDQGRRAGFASALGVEAATLVHVALAAVGLSAFLASSATAFSIVKYAGVAYLVYLGVRTLTAGDDQPADAEAAPEDAPARRVFAEGFVVNLLNPKVALFFLAFMPQFVDPGAGAAWSQVLVLGAVLVTIGLLLDLAYALGAGALGSWVRGNPKLARRRRYATGGIYLVLAAAALAAGRGKS